MLRYSVMGSIKDGGPCLLDLPVEMQLMSLTDSK